MKKILVIGSFMTDLVAVTKRAPIAGETIIGKSFAKFTGGKGANQAVTAARLGAEVTMIGKLGRDTLGEEHLEALKQDGINHEHVLFDDEASTGVGHIVLEESGNNRIIVIPGANLALTPEEIESFESVIAETDILILQLEIPFDSIYKAIELAHKHNKTIFLNPAPAADLDPKYVGLVDFIIPNESEAQLLTGIEVSNTDNARLAAQKLMELGCKNVIITLGERGVFFKNKEEEIFSPAFKVKAVDTTAAGDSFIGALAYSLANGKDFQSALQFSNAVGAVTVTNYGAQPSLPRLEQVNEFLKERLAE